MIRTKQISIWLIALMGLMIATGAVQAEDYDFKHNGLYYKRIKKINDVTYEVKVMSELSTSINYSPRYSPGNIPAGNITIPISFTRTMGVSTHTYIVTEIGDYAFIGEWAFYNCKGITSVTIPNSVTAIGEVAFAYCKGITSVSIPSSITTIEQRTFEGCSALKSITLPNSIQEIGNGVFYCCYALSEIYIPSSVTTIGKKILWECISLKTVTVHWDTPLAVPDNAFDGINTANVTLKVPAGKEDAYRAAAVWKDFKITDPAPDVTPPVPGDGGKLFVYITHKEFDPTWNSVFHTVEADANTEYEVYVRVKDEAGNYADYNKETFKTLSSPPPVPGNGGKLTVTDVTSNGFTVSWEKATDSETPQEKLIYKVYCKGGGGLLLFKPTDLKATLTDKASYTITGLGGGITIINPALDKGYDVNVEVIDEAGSSAWYNEENVKLAPATVAVTGVTVAPAALTLEVGQTGALTATVAPATATNKAVTWTSSAPAIATVDASGTVKGIAPGTATITVKTADGGKTATCAVTVKAAAAPAVKVTGITLNYSSITVNGDLERVQLIATVAPATATDQSLTWTSSDASVASVDGAGLVTIRKKGKATVTAKANDGSGVSASCLFDVIRTVANETIDGLCIYAADGVLRLALPAPETVHIYNVEGSLVKTLILPAGDHVLPLPSGVYVVRVGEHVTKVMVK